MVTTNEKLEFIYAMAKHSNVNLHDCKRIMRYAATHQRVETELCNGPDYSRCRNDAECNAVAKRWQAYQDTLPAKRDRIRRKIALTLPADVIAVFQGDARGCTVKLQVPDGYTNDWGKEGICVPA